MEQEDPKISFYNYVKDMLDIVNNKVDDYQEKESCELKEINSKVNSISSDLEKMHNGFITMHKEIDDLKNQLNETSGQLHEICSEIKEFKIKTGFALWLGKVVTSVPVKIATASAAISSILYLLSKYLH